MIQPQQPLASQQGQDIRVQDLFKAIADPFQLCNKERNEFFFLRHPAHDRS